MFLPDVLAGRSIAVAMAAATPLAEAVADAAGRAGAVVVLCGPDVERLDELAWDLAERRDAPVEIVAWDGVDPGAGLRAALDDAGHGDAALVLLGGTRWDAAAAAAWQRTAPVVVIAPAGDAAAGPAAGSACVLVVAPDAVPEHLGAWAAFLLSPAGGGAAGQVIHLM
ncbi:MAG: hypothetical protein WCZ23_12155 [Rhodospirillaceae bacterium]